MTKQSNQKKIADLQKSLAAVKRDIAEFKGFLALLNSSAEKIENNASLMQLDNLLQDL